MWHACLGSFDVCLTPLLRGMLACSAHLCRLFATSAAFSLRTQLEREKDKELRGVAAEALKELEETFSVGLALVADHREHSGIKPQADRGEDSSDDVPGMQFAEDGGSRPWWAVVYFFGSIVLIYIASTCLNVVRSFSTICD